MWKLEPSVEYEKRVRHWPKKYRRELLAMHDNLDTLFQALQRGANVNDIRFGFVHGESRRILAIDQKGAGAGVTQTRLYIFPDKSSKIVHLITVGDKGTQKADIRYAVEFVDNLNECEGQNDG